MCGISGWVSFERDLRALEHTGESMAATMIKRGPDNGGVWTARHAQMGHRRLSIIDLEGGVQPMTVSTESGDVTIVYSGEAYNFKELERELTRRGHRFDTSSDTEVVLHGYLEWGAEVVDKLNGMVAFAIWDDRTESLLLARDRMGIKPLYYHPTADGIMFGSEPKAILANPSVPRAVDADGVREMFSMIKTPGAAIWKGMYELEPGTLMTLDRSGSRIHRYWQLEAREHTDDQQTTVGHVRDLLEDIVARQLVSDVPRCTLLSGGLDSSALTAMAAEQLRGTETVNSYSVDFTGHEEGFTPDDMRATPDGPYAREVAENSGTRHENIVLDPYELADPDVRRASVSARDLPIGLGDLDPSLYLLFKAVRERSTVALSGESADEVFGGYKWFYDEDVRNGEKFPWIPQNAEWATPVAMDKGLVDSLKLDQFAGDEYRKALAEVPHVSSADPFERRMRELCYLHLTRFVRILLDRKDRMSMAASLEVRVPFCDHRLVEYVFNTPWSMKTFDGREKSILRAATADLLPKSVVERVKSPYPSTQNHAYNKAIQGQVMDLLADTNAPGREFLDADRLRREATRDVGELDMMSRQPLEQALNFAAWFDLYRPTVELA